MPKKTKKTIRKSANKNKKTTQKKVVKKAKRKIVAVSGGFDPVHIGHVRMFNEAKKLGDYLVVILNNDNWLKLKKGYVFMPQEERKEILESFEAIDEVVISFHPENTSDISIINELRAIRPHIFAKGGDRHSGNIPETPVCEEIGCLIVNDVGTGGKVQSSSSLVEKASENKKKLGQK
jgi:D-beta-D-heptose 7-phosphate kinase/D-beta-D-heptose 1-phosphate adenosyltransferase